MEHFNSVCCCWPAIYCYFLCISFFNILFFSGNAILQYAQKRFRLFYCNAGIVIGYHFVCNLMAFVCQEIKGLLTYLLILYSCRQFVCICVLLFSFLLRYRPTSHTCCLSIRVIPRTEFDSWCVVNWSARPPVICLDNSACAGTKQRALAAAGDV